MTATSCEIPVPVSANAMYKIMRTRKGGVFLGKSPEYKDWLLTAGMLMRAGLDKVVTLPVRVRLEVRGGDGFRRSRDLDNLLKATIDCLRAAKILPNDRISEVAEVSAKYLPVQDERLPAVCTVYVEQLEQGLFS